MSKTTATKKMTKKDYFNALLNIPAVKENPAFVKFIENELDILNRKNATASGDKKPTAKQTANEAIKDLILSVMTEELMTVTDIMKLDPGLGFPNCSNQFISTMLRQLKDQGLIVRIEDSRKTFFAKPSEKHPESYEPSKWDKEDDGEGEG